MGGGGWRERERERESEREGQSPQQQAWETSEISRELENSHHRRVWMGRSGLARPPCRRTGLFILWCRNTIPTCLLCNELQQILHEKLSFPRLTRLSALCYVSVCVCNVRVARQLGFISAKIQHPTILCNSTNRHTQCDARRYIHTAAWEVCKGGS